MTLDRDREVEDAFAIEPLDSPPIGPIDTDRKPKPPDLVKKELKELDFASPKKDDLEAGRYLDVIQALDRERLGPDEANNLGCAWAWLGYQEGEDAHWRAAIEALEKSMETAGSEAKRKRAENNREHVVRAWRLAAPK